VLSNKPRILCLEDDRSFIEFYVDQFAADYEIICATSLAEATRVLETEDIHLALVDISLIPNDPKDKGGFQFLERLQSLGMVSDIPTIIVTAYETSESMRRAFRDFGVADFFSKQELNPGELQKTIVTEIARILPARTIRETPRALVVEDDSAWREILQELLESEGCEVDVASTYQEASEKLTTRPYHLATIDIRLRDLDPTDTRGLELLDIARRIGLSVNSIIVSAVAKPDQITRALTELGVRDFFDKTDFPRGQFRRRVRRLLSRLIYITVTVGENTDIYALKPGEEQCLRVSVSRTRSQKGFSRILERPVTTGPFELEVVVHPYDVDVLPGSTQFLTVMPDDTAEAVDFKFIPTVAGRIELVVDLLYRSNMLARMSIAGKVIE